MNEKGVNDDDVNVADVSEDDVDRAQHDDALVSQLAVIEDLPLEARAAAYVQLHDELLDRLEGGDVPRSANG